MCSLTQVFVSSRLDLSLDAPPKLTLLLALPLPPQSWGLILLIAITTLPDDASPWARYAITT